METQWGLATGVLFAACALSACSGGSDGGSPQGSAAAGGNSMPGAGNGSAGSGNSSAGNGASGGGDSIAGASGNNGAAGNGAAGAGDPPVGVFQNGGGVYKTIVNIVDDAAEKQIERQLSDPSATDGYTLAAQAFFALYPDEYDFLYFVVDHEIPNSFAAASFQAVNQDPIPGTGIDQSVALPNYGTNGRLKGVTGAQIMSGMPPFAHELLHYWAVHLDASFGFGKDHDSDYPSHWGHFGVYGQLGGFEPSTLRCATPVAALPPACTPEANGRFRYATSAYAPNTNSFKGVPYAPIELYLMGLVPAADVPPTIQYMKAPQIFDINIDADTALVEADGLGELPFSDIVAKHGPRAPAADKDKSFSAAFVLVTSAPATPAVMDQVVEWQEIFGKHQPARGGWISFEQHTGGRAHLSTRIGRRRTSQDPAPTPPVPKTCELFAQNCGSPKLGCYVFDEPACYTSQQIPIGGACVFDNDCVPGCSCIMPDFTKPDAVCSPICDPNDDASAKACSKLCPGSFITHTNANLQVDAAVCQ
ncbi:MAG: hypothetical protein ABW061_00580 [Polyangiaceae bacterium]